MANFKGTSRNIFISINGTTWKPLICQQEATISYSRDVLEAASNCNPTGKEAGALDAEVSANGLSELAASTVAVSFKELEGYMVAPPAIFKVRVAGTTYSDTANRYTEGNAIITSLEENGVTEDIVTFSVTFNLKDIDLTP